MFKEFIYFPSSLSVYSMVFAAIKKHLLELYAV